MKNGLIKHFCLLMLTLVASSVLFSGTNLVWATPNYYQVLGVPENATEKVIVKAYRRKISRLHPDKFLNPSAEKKEELDEEAKKLNIAKDHLADKHLRAEHDAELRKSRAGSAKKFTDWQDFGSSAKAATPEKSQAPHEATRAKREVQIQGPQDSMYRGPNPKAKYYQDSDCLKKTLGTLLDVHI